TWNLAKPVRPDHPYLARKQVRPHGLRETSAGELVVPLRDLADAARQDRRKSVTNCYYKSFYNSNMSHSSALASYRPEGPAHRLRRARFDLSAIRDPEAWLTRRLGPLAAFSLELPDRPTISDAARLAAAAPAGAAQSNFFPLPITEANP